MISTIGEGAYATVHLAIYEKKMLALKQVSKKLLVKTNKIKSIFNEVDALKEGADSLFMPNFYF